MAKSIKSIYFDSVILIEAETQGIEISAICNEALLLAVNQFKNQGTTEGAFANLLQNKAMRTKDLLIVKKHYSNREKDKKGLFEQAISMYCEKYHLDRHEAMKEVAK